MEKISFTIKETTVINEGNTIINPNDGSKYIVLSGVTRLETYKEMFTVKPVEPYGKNTLEFNISKELLVQEGYKITR